MYMKKHVTKIVAILLLVTILSASLFALCSCDVPDPINPNQTTAGVFSNISNRFKKIMRLVLSFAGIEPVEHISHNLESYDGVVGSNQKTFDLKKNNVYTFTFKNDGSGEYGIGYKVLKGSVNAKIEKYDKEWKHESDVTVNTSWKTNYYEKGRGNKGIRRLVLTANKNTQIKIDYAKVIEHWESVSLNNEKTFNIEKGHRYNISLANYLGNKHCWDGIYYITFSSSADGLIMSEYISRDNGTSWTLGGNNSLTANKKEDNAIILIEACYKPLASRPGDESHKLSFIANKTCQLKILFKQYQDEYVRYNLMKQSYMWESIYSPYCETGRKCTRILYLSPDVARALSEIWANSSWRDKIKTAATGFNGKDLVADRAHSAILSALEAMSLDIGTSAQENLATMCGTMLGTLTGNAVADAVSIAIALSDLNKAFKNLSTTKDPIRVVFEEYVFDGTGVRVSTNKIQSAKTSGQERKNYGNYKYFLEAPAGCWGNLTKI